MSFLKNVTLNHTILIGVDGGINLSTIDKVYETNIDITIVGSAFFGASNLQERYLALMGNDK